MQCPKSNQLLTKFILLLACNTELPFLRAIKCRYNGKMAFKLMEQYTKSGH